MKKGQQPYVLLSGIILLAVLAHPLNLIAGMLDDSRIGLSSLNLEGFNQSNNINYPEEDRTEAEIIKTFVDAPDIQKMKRFTSFTCTNESSSVKVESIYEQGKLYAFYFSHTGNSSESQDKLTFSITNGTFRADWINPATKKIIHSEYFSVKKDKHKLTTPKYSTVLALKITRIL